MEGSSNHTGSHADSDPYTHLTHLLAEYAGTKDLLEMVVNHMRLLDHDQRIALGKTAPGLWDVLLQVEHRG